MELGEVWKFLQQLLLPFWPSLLLLALAALVMKLAHRKGERVAGRRFREQWLTVLVALVTVVGLLLTLPIDNDMRGQLLTLLGLLLTAIITLSSSTVAANAMAGFMLRSLKSFAPGDFIQVGEYFGKVIEQDLFHTEIQTEDRDLLTLPNLYLATNPVKVVHADGTIISAEVSLGYDVDHQLVEAVLLQAAVDAGLEEPFMQVTQLGDFSIGYKVAGFLGQVKQIISARSLLRKKIMDQLHGHDIEIVSPAFMNQRQVSDLMIPQRSFVMSEPEADSEPEDRIFDKADRAQQINDLKEARAELSAEIESLIKEDKSGNETLIERKQRRQAAIVRALSALKEGQ